MRKHKIWEKIIDELVIKSRENTINLDESQIAIDSQPIKTNGKFKFLKE